MPHSVDRGKTLAHWTSLMSACVLQSGEPYLLLRGPVEAKVFDPMDEQAVKAWLASGPKKELVGASLYKTSLGGVEREVAVVLYVEEHTISRAARDEQETRPIHQSAEN
jgi:hypothetical protein